jgi:hypothetical protein
MGTWKSCYGFAQRLVLYYGGSPEFLQELAGLDFVHHEIRIRRPFSALHRRYRAHLFAFDPPVDPAREAPDERAPAGLRVDGAKLGVAHAEEDTPPETARSRGGRSTCRRRARRTGRRRP